MEAVPEEAEVSEEQVELYMGNIAEQLVEALFAPGVPLERGAVKERALTFLKGQEGGRELMNAAFLAGQESVAAEPGAPRSGGGDPSWNDVENLGARRAMWKEENICLRCTHAAVCVVRRAQVDELLVTTARCLAFQPSSR